MRIDENQRYGGQCQLEDGVFRISLGYILGVPFKMGVAGIWMGMLADWLVRGLCSAFE